MSALVALDIRGLRPGHLTRFRGAVSAERRARAARFYFLEDQQRCLAAGVLLRYALVEHNGLSARDLEFATNEFGKPFLPDRAGVHFNLSHSGSWVVCATSTSQIGVDVEHSSAGSVDLARRFAPAEHAYVKAASVEEQPRRFAQIWTLKESYLKYLGHGLSVAFDSFSVATPERRLSTVRGAPGRPPYLKQVNHDGEYYIAECCADDSEITVQELPVEALLPVC